MLGLLRLLGPLPLGGLVGGATALLRPALLLLALLWCVPSGFCAKRWSVGWTLVAGRVALSGALALGGLLVSWRGLPLLKAADVDHLRGVLRVTGVCAPGGLLLLLGGVITGRTAAKPVDVDELGGILRTSLVLAILLTLLIHQTASRLFEPII